MEANIAPNQATADVRGDRSLRILVVWAVRYTRESLAEILERDPMVSIAGQCASLAEATALSGAVHCDVVLLDGRIPDGPAAVRRALEIIPDMHIIACSVRETEDDIIAWAEAGVIGYIPRTTPLADFVHLITEIYNGEQPSSGRVVTGLLRRIALTAKRRPDRGAAPLFPALTRRERQAA